MTIVKRLENLHETDPQDTTDTDASICDYMDTSSHEDLLLDLTVEVRGLNELITERLLKYIRAAELKWIAADIQRQGNDFLVLITQVDNSEIIATTLITPEFPFLYLALSHELLTLSAATEAIQGMTVAWDAVEVTLALGLRTPRSKARGFRWDASPQYVGEYFQRFIDADLRLLAEELYRQDPKYVVEKITVDYRHVVLNEDIHGDCFYYFDHYPFLAKSLLTAGESQHNKNIEQLNVLLNAFRTVDSVKEVF